MSGRKQSFLRFIPMFALLLVGCAPHYGTDFSWADVRGLQPGMSDAAVAHKLGGPPQALMSCADGSKAIVWSYSDQFIGPRSVMLPFGPGGLLAVPDVPKWIPPYESLTVAFAPAFPMQPNWAFTTTDRGGSSAPLDVYSVVEATFAELHKGDVAFVTLLNGSYPHGKVTEISPTYLVLDVGSGDTTTVRVVNIKSISVVKHGS